MVVPPLRVSLKLHPLLEQLFLDMLPKFSRTAHRITQFIAFRRKPIVIEQKRRFIRVIDRPFLLLPMS
jgi:hypothetical protein